MADTTLSMKKLSSELLEAIEQLKSSGTVKDSGIVVRVGDGIAWIYGLKNAGYNEMIEIEATDGTKITAFALNLMEDEIGAVILGEDNLIKAGARVYLTGKVLEVPIGPELIGRVVNPLGEAIDGGAPIVAKQKGLIERDAPGVLDRKSVFEPLMTGIVAVDALVPIGRGQRELIIGDRKPVKLQSRSTQ